MVRSTLDADHILAPELVQSFRRDAQGRIDDYSRLFIQVTNIWRQSEAAQRLVCARRFAGVAAALLGVPSMRLYHDQALFKPSGADPTPARAPPSPPTRISARTSTPSSPAFAPATRPGAR